MKVGAWDIGSHAPTLCRLGLACSRRQSLLCSLLLEPQVFTQLFLPIAPKEREAHLKVQEMPMLIKKGVRCPRRHLLLALRHGNDI